MRRPAISLLALVALGCGSTPAHVASPPPETEVVVAPPPPPFAGHGALTLRSVAPTRAAAITGAQPPLTAELLADGAVTGTRCGATRFTDEGALEREGTVVARVVRDGDALIVESGDGTALGWRIEASALITRGETRFTIDAGRISPSDAELPAVNVAPATTPDTVALAFFAALLVCDDVGP